MKAIYLSHSLEEQTPAYGGAQGTIQFTSLRSITRGDLTNELELRLPNHIGTHIDFPRHFSIQGKTFSDYPADYWLFNKVALLQCSIEEVPDRLAQLPADIELLLLKTGFAEKRNQPEYWKSQPVIPASFAGLFRQYFSKLRVFGFDMISLTSKLDRAEGKQAHLQFLVEHDILILEDMDLSGLRQAPYSVVIAPMQVKDADGVPCTVIATFI
jgi:arylformamidase